MALLPGLGDPAARAALAPRRTPSASGSRSCAGSPTPTADAPHRPAAGRGRAGRAACSSRMVPRPRRAHAGRACASARRPTWTTSSPQPRRHRLRAQSSWSRGAASSRCAAASSTSSRRPRSTRCAWSSGATRSRRSATSRSPTSASLEIAEDGLWAPPCRELLLTEAVRGRARQLAAEWPGLAEVLGKMAEGIPVEGMEALAPGAQPTGWSCCSTTAGRRHVDRLRPRAHPGPRRRPRRAPARSSSRRPGSAAAGGAGPDRPGGGLVPHLDEIRDLGHAIWTCRGGRSHPSQQQTPQQLTHPTHADSRGRSGPVGRATCL